MKSIINKYRERVLLVVLSFIMVSSFSFGQRFAKAGDDTGKGAVPMNQIMNSQEDDEEEDVKIWDQWPAPQEHPLVQRGHRFYDAPITKYAGDLIENVQRISRITGHASFAHGGALGTRTYALTDTYNLPDLNSTTGALLKLGGTDLGIPYRYKDELHIVFGDTFSGKTPTEGGDWRSQVILMTKDWTFWDGLDITIGGVGTATHAGEPIKAEHQDHIEMTNIPTGAIVIDDVIYIYYMSIRHWGDHGMWYINYGGVAKSTDGGKTFTKLPNMSHYSNVFRNFCQIFPMRVGNMVYLYGLSGGRSGGARLARVPVGDIEDMTKYRYFDGNNDDGLPQWIVYNEERMAFWNSDPNVEVFPPAVAEFSIVFNPYLNKFMATYANGGNLIMRLSDNPWGPFDDGHVIFTGDDYVSFYNAFTCEETLLCCEEMYKDGVFSDEQACGHKPEDRGKLVYFFTSQWPGAGTTLPFPTQDYFSSMFRLKLK